MEIKNLEPRRVFRWFEKIAAIPHGSGNTKKLAEFIMDFAKDHGLKAVMDKVGNVAVFKDGSEGREEEEAIILQGHIDMVCEKTPDADIDMSCEAITLCTNGTDVWAKDTTLGGDDGIAVAYMLAILDSDIISHPPIEALFTIDEEVGLVGAANLEITDFKAKRLINLDSEEEGILTVSCAGAARAVSTFPMNYECNLDESDKKGFQQKESDHELSQNQSADQAKAFRITLSGMKGGHSGVDINKCRQNAAVLMGRLLTEMIDAGAVLKLASIECGGRDNVIPSSCQAVVVVKEDINSINSQICQLIDKLMADVKAELAVTEPDFCWKLEEVEMPEKTLTKADSDKLAFILYNIPDGLIVENPEIEGMTRTSLNSGSVFLKDIDGKPVLEIGTMMRSNLDSERVMITRKVRRFVEFLGGQMEVGADYPAWPYASKSPLRDLMVKVYADMYGKEPVVSSIHAGLECGILTGKLGELDMVSIGPDLFDVHSPKERMNVGSVQRSWEYLLEILKAM